MAYKDKIQKIAEDKKTKDRIEYFSNRKFGKCEDLGDDGFKEAISCNYFQANSYAKNNL